MKTTAATLLLVGLLLAGLGAFLPTGEAWTERNSIRDTETYSVFTYDFARTNDDAVLRHPAAVGWTDASMDGDAGSNLMVAASFTAIGALLVSIVGVVLVFPKRTTRFGAVITIVGAAAVAAVTILVILGMRARVDSLFGSANSLNPLAGLFLLGFGFFLLLIGAAFALTIRNVVGEATNTWEDYPAHVEAQQHDGGQRTLVCPECNTRTKAALGVIPTCGACGFHRHAQESATTAADDTWAVPTA